MAEFGCLRNVHDTSASSTETYVQDDETLPGPPALASFLALHLDCCLSLPEPVPLCPLQLPSWPTCFSRMSFRGAWSSMACR